MHRVLRFLFALVTLRALSQILELFNATLTADAGFLLQIGNELFCSFVLGVYTHLGAHLRGLRLDL